TPWRHVVSAAHRYVDPDHVALQRHHRIERRRPSVVTPPHTDPADPHPLSLFDCNLGGKPHHQVAHAVVAIDQGGRVGFLRDCDVWFHIHSACSNTANVLRQAEDAVTV